MLHKVEICEIRYRLHKNFHDRPVRDARSCSWRSQKLVYGTRCSATKEKGEWSKEDDRETYNCSPILGEQPLVDEPCHTTRDSIATHT